MRNKKQLLEKELKLKIELVKINFMECGLSEQEAVQYIEQILKNCIQKKIKYYEKIYSKIHY